MRTFDVVVVGGGIVGAGLALALRSSRLSLAWIEPHARPGNGEVATWDGRIYALTPGNASWLSELGVWQRLPEDRVSRVESMRIFGDRSVGRLEFDAYDAGLRELAFVVENRALLGALRAALEGAEHVVPFRSQTCANVTWERECAVLSPLDGSELAARLVVGADGADSWVRAQAGISSRVHDYEQTGVVANFACERPHGGTAFQWFREDGVLALLPLPGNRTSMVWSTGTTHAQHLSSLAGDALCRVVEEVSARALGALELITPAAGFPLRRQHVARLVEPRVALVGDAAHNVHPLAGQGLNLGLRDVRALSTVLAARGPICDCGEYGLLRRYERARKEDIAALELTTDGLQKLFASRAVWLAGLRNLGLTLVNAPAPLKNLLIRHAVA
ncbi:MAG: UbiH/UbiF family hydroxylase [Burkholderiales bacterium]